MARQNTPIWQDKSVLTTAHVYILKNGVWVDTGRHFTALPGESMPNYWLNQVAEDYVKAKNPSFGMLTLYSAYTETQPDAYQVFKTDYTGSSPYNEYGIYNDWSYEKHTDSGHCQNAPVNHHADARQILTYGRWGVSGESIVVKEMLKPVIKATPNQLFVGAEDTYAQTIVIQSNKVGELIIPEWLNVSQTSITVGANTIYVYPNENTDWDNRDGNIIVKCEGYEEEYDYLPVVYINQAGIVPYFSVYPVEQSYQWNSGTTVFLVHTNVPYTATTNQSWITYAGSSPASQHNYNAAFNVSANTGDNREAVITFTYKTSSATTATTSAVLRQAHAPLISANETQVPIISVLSSSVTITSEAAWTGVSSESWATISPSTGSTGIVEVAINCSQYLEAHPRTCTLTFINEAGNSVTVSLIQETMDLQNKYIYKTTNGQPISNTDLRKLWSTASSVTIGGGYYEIAFPGGEKPDVPYQYFLHMQWPEDLFEIYVPDNVNEIGDCGFCYNGKLEFAYIGAKRVGSSAFYGCTGLTGVYITDKTTTIDAQAFSGCTSLTSVTIPDNVTTLGQDCFKKCNSLSSVYVSSAVTTIPYRAFGDCTALSSITIGPNVETISDYAFNDCKIRSFNIGDSVKTIGKGAFEACPLTSLTIGSGVTSIGGRAFNACYNLFEITYNGTVDSFNAISKGSIWKNDTLRVVHCTDGDIEYYNAQIDIYNAYDSSRYSRAFIIPSSANWSGATVQFSVSGMIGFNGYPKVVPAVFSGYTSPEFHFVLPECIETLNNGAFMYSTALVKITLPSTLKKIESTAFYNCNNLTDVYYNGTKAQWANVQGSWQSPPGPVVHCLDGNIG